MLKLKKHDLLRIYPKLHVIPTNWQQRGMHTILRCGGCSHHPQVWGTCTPSSGVGGVDTILGLWGVGWGVLSPLMAFGGILCVPWLYPPCNPRLV